MPPVTPLPPPRYLRYALITLTLAVSVLLGLPFLLHNVLQLPASGGFGPDKLNAFALAATLFWLVLQLGYLGYRLLFRRFRIYQGESLEKEGKLFENVTDELRAPLYAATLENDRATSANLSLLTERRKVAQFQFTVRCVRLLFCFAALYVMVQLAQWAVTVGMGLLPGGLK